MLPLYYIIGICQPHTLEKLRKFLARLTGLEPATTGSTVRYSNQLSYDPSELDTSICLLYSGIPPLAGQALTLPRLRRGN